MRRVFWSVVVGVVAAVATGFIATVVVVLYAFHHMPPPGPNEAIGWDPISFVHGIPAWAWLMLLVAFAAGFGLAYRHQAKK